MACPRIVPGPSRPVVRPLDRGLTVAADHLLHLGNALGDVHGERHPALAAPPPGCRAADPAVQVSICIGDTTPDRRPQGCSAPHRPPERSIEAVPAARLVPGILQLVVVLDSSAPRHSRAPGSRAARSWRTARPSRPTPARCRRGGHPALAAARNRRTRRWPRGTRHRAPRTPASARTARSCTCWASRAPRGCRDRRLVLGVGMHVDQARDHREARGRRS